MENKGFEAENVLRFQINRILSSLFKKYLIILEDMGIEHDIALQKLYDNLPEEYKIYVKLADYFGEEKYNLLRSKILDDGNDAYRQIEEQLKNFEIKIKKP